MSRSVTILPGHHSLFQDLPDSGMAVALQMFLNMEETQAERQLTAATELLPMFVSMAASVKPLVLLLRILLEKDNQAQGSMC